jgi:hypothetical protein
MRHGLKKILTAPIIPKGTSHHYFTPEIQSMLNTERDAIEDVRQRKKKVNRFFSFKEQKK